MYSQEILEKFAKLTVKMGANVQKGQPVIIRTPIEAIEFARIIAKECYESGASIVRVDIQDGTLVKYNYQYQSIEDISDIPDWSIEKELWYINKGTCKIAIDTLDPDAMKGIDTQKLIAYRQSYNKKKGSEEIRSYSMNNKGQWTIVAYPSIKWAKKVFPKLSDDEALEKLGEAILKCTRISVENDPIEEWKEHNRILQNRSKIMNEFKLKSLHYTNSLGTDLTIELPVGHIWAGGSEYTIGERKVEFNPNMPTEELFSLPHKTGVNGIVYATKPLVYNGNIINNFWIKFKDGKAVEYDAEEGKEYLKMLIELDEGSCYLGEVALVPFDSPVNNSGILFYNTLFDENASCHLALGRAYPSCIEGGTDMNKEELEAHGVNISMEHCDFMVGSKDLNIEGTTLDGKKVTIFKNGNFVF